MRLSVFVEIYKTYQLNKVCALHKFFQTRSITKAATFGHNAPSYIKNYKEKVKVE